MRHIRPQFHIIVLASFSNISFMLVVIAISSLLSAVAAAPSYNIANFPLVQASIIPNVLPDFNPKTFPLLKFTKDVAFLGNNIAQADAAAAPTLSFFGSPEDLFTLAIVDPDAPERSNNIISQVQHFLAFNIPGNTLGGNLTTLGDRPTGSLGYLGPSPPPGCGTHRYVVALFKQPARIDANAAGFGTAFYPLFFNIKQYAAANKLQLVGANYWRTTAAPAPFCTFFTDASETVIAEEFAVGFGLGTDPSVYSRSPN
jgi:phosphatidylethanolamine-binding protein (PEBP) family uncharacterized protein